MFHRIRPAPAPAVEEEDIKERAKGNLSIERATRPPLQARRDWGIIEPSSSRTGCEDVAAFLSISRVFDDFARPPVIFDLMVIPKVELRDERMKAPLVLIEEWVAVAPPKLRDALCDLLELWGDEVIPAPVLTRAFHRTQRLIGIDPIPTVDETVGRMFTDRVIDLETTPLWVNPIPLAEGVT